MDSIPKLGKKSRIINFMITTVCVKASDFLTTILSGYWFAIGTRNFDSPVWGMDEFTEISQ